ncbi:Cupredoxin [Russula aff. rugulosa BPL654]|nr:Cupredoxin [Russula aff. rugulosa BPL654]
MLQLRAPAFIFAAVAGSISALGPHAKLPIVNKHIAPDGFPRLATLAGGSFPGPVISAKKGDEFSINVTDQLTDRSLELGTSVHWHGIAQRHTNFVDGPVGVTQCPLVPNENFVYQFNALDQAGTFWYHSHFKNQYCDGLRGPLIIYDPDDPHKCLYDVDDVVQLCLDQCYRFRLISISCEPHFTFSIDGHQMTVIEVEGTNVQPLVVDSIQIFAGQRYSVVVDANQRVDNYWIRALPGDAETPLSNFSDFNNVAILHYEAAECDEPSQKPWVDVPRNCLPLVETNLHPGKPFPGGADININLNVTRNTNPIAPGFLINGASFQAPPVPVLLQILSGAKNASDLVPAGSIYGLGPNKSVELTIPAVVLGPHPVHLHGHSFAVVRSAGNSSYNFVDPVFRDVVSIGEIGDNVTIRFFTDNPGPCGFAVVFAEDVPDVPSQDYTNASVEPDDESSERWALDDSDSEAAYIDKPTRRRRSTRKRRNRKGDANTSRATSRISPESDSIPAVSLQPLLDFLASKYAPEDSEDATFDDVAGFVLVQCAERRDELEEQYERDDLGRPYSLLSASEETTLIEILEARPRGSLTVAEAIILRKLKVHRHLRTHNLPRPLLRPKPPATLVALPPTPKRPEPDPEVLGALYDIRTTPYRNSFLWRLNGFVVHRSPVIAADWENSPSMAVVQESVAPVTYVTLTAEHLLQVHDILHRLFWSGIDISDSLQHEPEKATIVAMYKRLVVGCAILSSPVETYITYLAVRAGWENAQIATTMLFHLINRNPNKDITLHVSTNNPAMV